MTGTPHSHRPNFGRHVPGCTRCQELLDGTPAEDRPTAHTCGGPVFGRKTPGCPRCDELINGAEPRVFTSIETARRYAQYDRQRAEEIRRHNCQRDHGGGVCTAFDW